MFQYFGSYWNWLIICVCLFWDSFISLIILTILVSIPHCHIISLKALLIQEVCIILLSPFFKIVLSHRSFFFFLYILESAFQLLHNSLKRFQAGFHWIYINLWRIDIIFTIFNLLIYGQCMPLHLFRSLIFLTNVVCSVVWSSYFTIFLSILCFRCNLYVIF